jgi:hypothetical protein
MEDHSSGSKISAIPEITFDHLKSGDIRTVMSAGPALKVAALPRTYKMMRWVIARWAVRGATL